MTDKTNNRNAVATGAFLDKTYEEALALVDRTVRYIEEEAPRYKKTLSTGNLARAAIFSMQHSTELMQIMAWLLLHKAVKAGEITLAKALAPHNLLGMRKEDALAPRPTAQTDADLPPEDLPRELKELMSQSAALYQRIVRLEQTLLGETAEHPLHRLTRDYGG